MFFFLLKIHIIHVSWKLSLFYSVDKATSLQGEKNFSPIGMLWNTFLEVSEQEEM